MRCTLTCFNGISVGEGQFDSIMLNLGGDDVWSKMVVDGTVLGEAPLTEVCYSTVKNNVVGL